MIIHVSQMKPSVVLTKGMSYRTNDGRMVTILDADYQDLDNPDSVFFIGDNGRQYDENGIPLFSFGISPDALVSHIH